VWIEVHVRIALRMNVAERTIDSRGHFEQVELRRRLEVARRARLDARIARFLHEDRQPADFELRAGGDHQVGRAGARNETGLGVDAVDVLQRARRNVDIHAVATELGGQGAPIRRRGENLECGLRRNRSGQKQHRQQSAREMNHHCDS
jgi:hypothetical protein